MLHKNIPSTEIKRSQSNVNAFFPLSLSLDLKKISLDGESFFARPKIHFDKRKKGTKNVILTMLQIKKINSFSFWILQKNITDIISSNSKQNCLQQKKSKSILHVSQKL